jgi:hypothetical protein
LKLANFGILAKIALSSSFSHLSFSVLIAILLSDSFSLFFSFSPFFIRLLFSYIRSLLSSLLSSFFSEEISSYVLNKFQLNFKKCVQIHNLKSSQADVFLRCLLSFTRTLLPTVMASACARCSLLPFAFWRRRRWPDVPSCARLVSMLGIQELRPKPIERWFGLTPVVEWDVSL